MAAHAFDSIAYPVEPPGKSLADWEKVLLGVHAGGATSCGVALERMRRQGQRVEQLVLVTDEGENAAPLFKDAYAEYARELNVRPAVVIVKVGQQVTQGTPVGLEGSTGNSTGPHLHFELRIGQRPVDPTPYLPPGPPSAFRG